MKTFTASVHGQSFTECDNDKIFTVSSSAHPDDMLIQASNMLAGVIEYETEKACRSNLHYLMIHTLEAVKALIDSVEIKEVQS